MHHIYQVNDESHPTFILLHGTGGDEKDLIPLAQMIDERASYCGILGEVRENGMPRFFKRLALNVFDEADITYRTQELHSFIMDFVDKHELDKKRMVLLGYSNGANMAQSLLLHYPDAYFNVIMLHPISLKKELDFHGNDQIKALVASGRFDPICPLREGKDLLERLKRGLVDASMIIEDTDHQLTYPEIEKVKTWYENHIL